MTAAKNTANQNKGNAAKNVTIGCKLPHGLELTIDDKTVVLAGTNSANIIGGFGITEDVDEEFFDAWRIINRQHPAVEKELIFKAPTTAEAKAEATDNAEKTNGFEAIDPVKPGGGVEPVPAK